MELILVRHGENPANIEAEKRLFWQDEDLTARGHLEAIACGEIIVARTVVVDAHVRSPLKRAKQTSEHLGAALHVPATPDKSLSEMDFGEWNDKPVRQYGHHFRNLSDEDRPYFRPPGGESFVDVADRMEQVVRDLKAAGKLSVLLVTHRQPIKSLIGRLMSLPPSRWRYRDIETGSVTFMRETDSGWSLVDYVKPEIK